MATTTRREVERLVWVLAAACGKPYGDPWVRTADGHNVARVGCWHLDNIWTGRGRLYRIVEMCNEAGGQRDTFGHRNVSLGELARSIRCALDALRAALGEAELAARTAPVWKLIHKTP